VSLEKKILYIQQQPLNPRLNIAVNASYFNFVKNGSHDAVVRIYKHTPGIILSKNQSLNDLNESYCTKNDLEIASRPTGGGAVYVSPEHTLCYSVILNSDLMKFENKLEITDMYKKFTQLLNSKLQEKGLDVDLSGAGWYVMSNPKGDRIPLIGHSLHLSGNIYQIDGIVNLQKLPIETVSNAIKLRKLYSDGTEKYLHANNKYIGKIPSHDSLNLLRDEHAELQKLYGIHDLNLHEKEFQDVLIDTLTNLLGDFKIIEDTYDYSNLDYSKLRMPGSEEGLGHCFFRYP